MREPVPIKHLILYALLICNSIAPILIPMFMLFNREPRGEEVGLLISAILVGFFGTLIWCIRFATSDPRKTRFALIVLLIASAINFVLVSFPTF